MEAPEVESHHHHHTGHKWLDIVLAGSAIVISVISLFLGIHHGKTMEKLVEANTWPYVMYAASNGNAQGEHLMSFQLVNSGVGPARIETFEVFYKDKPIASPRALFDACCGTSGKEAPLSTRSSVNDWVLPAREMITFLSVKPQNADPAVYAALEAAQDSVQTRVCYCSVFDECWLRDSRKNKADLVKSCPTPPVKYRE